MSLNSFASVITVHVVALLINKHTYAAAVLQSDLDQLHIGGNNSFLSLYKMNVEWYNANNRWIQVIVHI